MGGIPDHYTFDVDLVSPVDITGIPTTYHINIDSLPKIQIGVDPITVNPLTVTVNPLTVHPLDVTVRLKEFPSIRGHIPANFTVGMSILGLQLFCIRLCGEAQVITEPYVPNPCEECGESQAVPIPAPNPPGVAVAAKVSRPNPRKV